MKERSTAIVPLWGFLIAVSVMSPKHSNAQAATGPLAPAESQEQSPAKTKQPQVPPRTTLAGPWQLNRDASDDPHQRVREIEAQALSTLVATLGEAILGTADIRGVGGIREAAIPGVDIPGAATREVILEGIRAGAEVIHTQGVEAEDPTGEEELPRRTLKVTRKCSR